MKTRVIDGYKKEGGREEEGGDQLLCCDVRGVGVGVGVGVQFPIFKSNGGVWDFVHELLTCLQSITIA